MPTSEQKEAFLRDEIKRLQAALAKAESRAEVKDKTIRQLKKSISERDERIKERDERIKERDAHIERQRTELTHYKEACSILACVLDGSLELLQKSFPDIPEAQRDRVEWLVKRTLADVEDDRPVALLRYLLSSGTESMDKIFGDAVEAQAVQAAQNVASMNASIEAQEKKTNALINRTSEAAIEASKENPDDAALQAARAVAEAPRPPKKPAKKPAVKLIKKKKNPNDPDVEAKTRGRVVPAQKLDPDNVYEKAADLSAPCPICGGHHEKAVVAKGRDFIRYIVSSLSKLVKEGTFNFDYVHCKDCGRIYADRPPEMPVPYSLAAGCQTSADAVIEVGNAVASGTPLNRIESHLSLDDMQMATEQFGRPITAWATAGIGGILVQQIVEDAKKTPGIGADETRLRVLEDDDKPGASHIIVRTSNPGEDKQFAVYNYMESRSSQAIEEQFNGWQFKTLNKDGYEGYNGALKARSLFCDVVVQICNAHARRKLGVAVDAKNLAEIVMGPDGIAKAKERYKQHDPQLLICSILDALSMIYSWEKQGRRQSNETREEQLKRIEAIRAEHCRPLMDHIDAMMDTLSKTFAMKGAGGKWEKSDDGGNPLISKAVVFWLNHQQELRAYLTNPQISLDSNNVERCIRAIAVYRNAAFFKRSVQGAKAFCNLLTLRESAKLNGIKDVPKWLKAYHRAFYEHVERYVLTERYLRLRPGQPLNVKIPSVPKEAIETFDFRPYMPRNYAASLPASERCEPI